MERARQRYGDVFTVRLLDAGPVVFVADPELVKDVFTGSARLLHAGEGNAILEPVVGSRSVLLLDEDEHLRERKLLLPSFHGERIRAYAEVMAAAADDAIDRWPVGRPFPLQPEMAAVTLEVIVRAVFGVEEATAQAELAGALRRMLDHGTSPLAFLPALQRDLGPRSPYGRFLAARDEVDGMLYAEFPRRRAAGGLAERADVLSLLLEARHEDDSPMSDRELRDELVTLLVAGHETTATALAWAFELLFRHPHVLDRLTAAVEGGDGAYVDAVAREVLRLRPVLPLVGRKLTAPMDLGRWRLPAGTLVAPCVYLMHRRPDVYPDPYGFRPERFLDTPPGTYTWLPFGGGIRRCLGASFALLELRTVLERVVARADLRPASGRPEGVARRSITLTPRNGALAVLAGRRPRGEAPAPAG